MTEHLVKKQLRVSRWLLREAGQVGSSLGKARRGAAKACRLNCRLTGFKAWLRNHRGASDATLRLHARDAAGREDPANWDAASIRGALMDRASTSGRGTVENVAQ